MFRSHRRDRRTRQRRRSFLWRSIITATLALALVVPFEAAKAETSLQVSVEVGLGMAHVAWTEVEGADNYQIERTLMDGDSPAEDGVVVGIWSPNRGGDNSTLGPWVFADHGFPVGERYRWRVRPVVAGTPGDWSDPVIMDTPGHPGPVEFLSGFELSNGVRWTTHEEEVALLEGIAAASNRIRLETIGTTYEGRPIHSVVVGHPAPGTPEEIADSGSVLLAATVHGTERSGREAALTLLRQLAFSNESWVTDLLDNTTVILVPTQNPDGQANSQRSNLSGQDLNRDHILLRHPEALGIAKVIRDYQPDIIVDSHENPGGGPDLQFLWPRSLAVEENLFSFNQMTFGRGFVYGAASDSGLSPGQWGTHRTDNWETLLSNVSGLKNSVGLLVEVPWNPQAAHPAEGPNGSPENQRRRSYAAFWTFRTVLEYHAEKGDNVRELRDDAVAHHAANEGPLYLDGAYPIPVSPPITDPSTLVLQQPMCGYRLSPEQYAARDANDPGDEVEWISATVEDRLAAHGVVVEEVGSGIVQVRVAQPLRPLIPFMLDPELDTPVRPEGLPNIGMVDATRLDDDRATVIINGVDSGVPNRVGHDGCSIGDLIADEQDWPNHGQFVRHVTSALRDLRAEGLLSAREAAAIMRAGASCDSGAPSCRP